MFFKRQRSHSKSSPSFLFLSVFFLFVFLFILETRFYYVSLAMLELTIKNSLASRLGKTLALNKNINKYLLHSTIIFFFIKEIYFICINIFACAVFISLCPCNAQKRASDPLELELMYSCEETSYRC